MTEVSNSELGRQLMKPSGDVGLKVAENMNVTNAKFTRTVGDSKTHLKLHVRQKRSLDLEMDGIGFDLGHWAEAFDSGQEIDLLFSIEENEWNGRVTLQLNVKDIRVSDEAYDSATTQSIKDKV